MPTTSDKREQTAILIQRKIRGILTRKKTKRPQLAKLENYETLITGNDGAITFTPSEFRHDGKFIFVGCSGMNSLAILRKLINFRVYMPSKNGCDNIPKLYIIDNSIQVRIFWENLRKALIKSKNQSDFNSHVLAINDKFVSCCRKLDSYCDCYMCNNFAALTITAKLQKITRNDDFIFQFVRNVVEKMTFLSHDWTAKEPFAFINRHKGNLAVYVYPSNIVEFLSMCPVPDISHAMNQVVTNICRLKPVVTLHTRTEFSYRACYRGICPKNMVKVGSIVPQAHFQALEAPKFGPLIPKQGLFNSFVFGAFGAAPPPGSFMDITTGKTVVPKPSPKSL